MKIARADAGFLTLVLMGVLICIFPALVITPSSIAWRNLTGQVDLFEVRALWSWLILLGALLVCSICRAIFLLSQPTKATAIHMAYYALTVFLIVSATVVVFWQ